MRPRKQRSQAVVEFGIVALTFTLLMFAVVDLGMLLNTWVRLSSATREVGRAATVGYTKSDVSDMVKALSLPGVSTSLANTPFNQYCCGDAGSNAKIVLSITYYDGSCIPGAGGCNPLPSGAVDAQYWGGTSPCGGGGCTHPARGDIIVVGLAAPGMEVITPLVRPFFGCSGSSPHCFVRLGSTALMRYEGQ